MALHRNHDFNNNSKHIRLIIWIITRQRNFILNVQDLCIKVFKRKTQKEVTSFSCEIWCCLIIPFIRHMLSFFINSHHWLHQTYQKNFDSSFLNTKCRFYRDNQYSIFALCTLTARTKPISKDRSKIMCLKM